MDKEFRKDNNAEEPQKRYVNLLSNAGFKAVFGDRENDDVIMSILNTLLPVHRKVTHIQCLPTSSSS